MQESSFFKWMVNLYLVLTSISSDTLICVHNEFSVTRRQLEKKVTSGDMPERLVNIANVAGQYDKKEGHSNSITSVQVDDGTASQV